MAEKSKNSIMTRIASAVVLAPLVLWVVYEGGLAFELLIALAAMTLVYEWTRMVGRKQLWLVLGGVYIASAVFALWWLREGSEQGLFYFFWLLAVVWLTDIGGYMFGLTIGGPKLAPAISPKKTWSGFVGGVTLAMGGGYLVQYIFSQSTENTNFIAGIGLSAGISVVSQLGDLLESMVKRRFGVKDSGNVIPGHGGLFDRVDGLLAAAIVLVLINFALGKSII